MSGTADHVGCVVDPAKENWRIKNDADVWHAAQDGVHEAQRELKRREATAGHQ